MKTLKQLPPELVSSRGGPVRSALRKASLIMVNSMKANLEKIIAENNAGDLNESTGLLRENIVTTRSSRMTQKGERYSARIRRKAYPSNGGKPVSTPQVARLLEYGTEKRRPMPFIRPAFDTNKRTVVYIFTDEINKGLQRIVRKLARQNRVA